MIAPTEGRAPAREAADPVVTLHWPAQTARRRLIAESGRAALLVVVAGEPPPTDLGPLEDWIRAPLDPDEAAIRNEELRLRHRLQQGGVHVDDEQVLHAGGRSVVLTDLQHALVVPLLTQIGQPVARAVVEEAAERAGGPTDPAHLRRALSRLRARVSEVGLGLHLLSGRAVLLEAPPEGQFT